MSKKPSSHTNPPDMVIGRARVPGNLKVTVPGSKSYTNRALLLGALAEGKSRLINTLKSDDTVAMMHAIRALGIKTKKNGNTITVTGSGGRFKKPRHEIFLGNAGTATRFLTAVLATCPFVSTVTGNARMKERPIEELARALRKLGARVDTVSGCPPVTVKGPLTGGKTVIRGDMSSQFVSALLMAAPNAKKTTEIRIGGAMTSLPYILMTLDIMKLFGARYRQKNERTFIINPHTLKGRTYSIEGDASSATYPLALAALHGTKVTILNVPGDSKQADMAFLDVAKKMGCSIKKTTKTITVKGPKKLLSPGKIRLNDLPDAAMTVAILCACAEGTSKLTGLHTLRIKETDRLHALYTELKKIGANVREGKDSLLIKGTPGKLKAGRIETYNDHRMAMCFAIAGSLIPGMKIMNPACVSKTYPDFWKHVQQWGVPCSQHSPQ